MFRKIIFESFLEHEESKVYQPVNYKMLAIVRVFRKLFLPAGERAVNILWGSEPPDDSYEKFPPA